MSELEAIADMLHERQIGEEISKAEEEWLKEKGIVVVFGASDDNMEFRGAINDEFLCYEAGTAYITEHGLVGHTEEYCEQIIHDHPVLDYKTIKAVWEAEGNKSEYSWIYETDIPHKTFDILEDNVKYCRGIVFSMKSMKG